MMQLAINNLLSKAEAETQASRPPVGRTRPIASLCGRRASRLPKEKTCGKLTADVSDQIKQDHQSLRIASGRLAARDAGLLRGQRAEAGAARKREVRSSR